MSISSPFQSLRPHPLAPKLPPMSEEQFSALVASISADGLFEPVLTIASMIVDGWHRYLACEIIYRATGENHLITVEFANVPASRKMAFAKNLVRREHTESQRAMLAVLHKELLLESAELHSEAGGQVAEKLSRAVGVCRRYIHYASAVKKHGSTRLVEAVSNGLVPVDRAHAIAKSCSAKAIDEAIDTVQVALTKEVGRPSQPSRRYRKRFREELEAFVNLTGQRESISHSTDLVATEVVLIDTPSNHQITIAQIIFAVEGIVSAYAGNEPARLAEVEAALRGIADACNRAQHSAKQPTLLALPSPNCHIA